MMAPSTSLADVEKRVGIPKRLIQIYCPPPGSGRKLPLLYQAAATSATLHNPGFEHLLFDNEMIEAFLDQEPPIFRQTMNSFRFPIQRFDFFRYLAVFRLGGIYLDLDVFLARDFSSLLDANCVFPFEELTLNKCLREKLNMDWELGNYAFGAESEHPFIKAIIDNCIRAQQDPAWAEPMMQGIPGPLRKKFFVVNTTGPGLVTRTLAEKPEFGESITILFPENVCDERTWHRFGDYGVHLMNSSWRPREGLLYGRLARLWENWRRSKVSRQSNALGGRREGKWNSRIAVA